MARGVDRALVGRLVAWALIVIGGAFAVQGGEYSTLDLLRQRHEERTVNHAIDSLTRVVDSLTRYERLVETDPAMQERIAREEFGMVKDKELLYRFVEPSDADTARRN